MNDHLACGEPGCGVIVETEAEYHDHYREAHIPYYDDAPGHKD